jgi:hypothetical protein
MKFNHRVDCAISLTNAVNVTVDAVYVPTFDNNSGGHGDDDDDKDVFFFVG